MLKRNIQIIWFVMSAITASHWGGGARAQQAGGDKPIIEYEKRMGQDGRMQWECQGFCVRGERRHAKLEGDLHDRSDEGARNC